MTRKLWINLLIVGLLVMGMALIGFGIWRYIQEHPDTIMPPVSVTLESEG